jgi:hypothetical protein
MSLVEQLERAFGHRHDCYYRPSCVVCWTRAYRDLFRFWIQVRIVNR